MFYESLFGVCVFIVIIASILLGIWCDKYGAGIVNLGVSIYVTIGAFFVVIGVRYE